MQNLMRFFHLLEFVDGFVCLLGLASNQLPNLCGMRCSIAREDSFRHLVGVSKTASACGSGRRGCFALSVHCESSHSEAFRGGRVEAQQCPSQPLWSRRPC